MATGNMNSYYYSREKRERSGCRKGNLRRNKREREREYRDKVKNVPAKLLQLC